MSKRQRRTRERHRRHRRIAPTKRQLAAAGGLALGASLVTGASAQAADYTVNDLGDPGAGGCNLAECTLREAIVAANAGGADRVLFESGLSGTITLAGNDDLDVTDDTQILGPGADQITVDGDDSSRVLDVSPGGGAPVTISGLTLFDGNAIFSTGAGISNSNATLTVSSVTFDDNYGDFGGALFSAGPTTVTGSTFTNNEGFYVGGAIFNVFPLTVSGSSFTGNFTTSSAPGNGGGAIRSSDDATVSNSVLSGNDSAETGGGIWADTGSLTLESSTLSGNTADQNGGGIYTASGTTLTVRDSTVSANTAYAGTGNGNYGGGVYSSSDSLVIERSAILGNTAGEDGGGLYIDYNPSTNLIRNSTLAGNNALLDDGGAMWAYLDNGASLDILDSTIAGNSAANYGDNNNGAILGSENEAVNLRNTIVANNPGGTPGELENNFDAAFSLLRNPGSDAILTQSVPGSNIFGADPQLGGLASNGGPTQTMALAQSSPAVDKGSSSADTDQRGSPRPFDFLAIPNSAAAGANGADMGAYELAGANPKCKGKTATIVASGGTTKGTDKRDVIVGTNAKNKINSRGGKDLICAKGGKDTVKAGGGKDKVFGQGGKDKLRGGGGNDKLVGGAKKDKLFGQGGKDKLLGKGGKDKLVGGAKKDRLIGGGGNDTCIGGPGRDFEKSC